jgi:uncharacterized protein YcsI (UPF0317 family)
MPFDGNLEGLSGDERSAFVFAGLGVDLDTIDCPLTIRRHVGLIREGVLAAQIGMLSQATVRSFAPITPADVARLTGVACSAALVHGAPAPLLTGADLIARGLKPGPEFGRILKAALDSQDAGDFTDKEGALAWLDASGL